MKEKIDPWIMFGFIIRVHEIKINGVFVALVSKKWQIAGVFASVFLFIYRYEGQSISVRPMGVPERPVPSDLELPRHPNP